MTRSPSTSPSAIPSSGRSSATPANSGCGGSMTDPLRRFSPWFYAAAAYNLTWGTTNVLAPALLTRPLGLGPHGLVAWQAVGMLVLVYAPGYWWAGRRPSQHAPLIAIAVLGKTLGPIGFPWAAATGKQRGRAAGTE